MKNSTQQILNWLNNQQIENQIIELQKTSPDFLEYETTIEEAIIDLNSIKDLLLAAIEEDVLEQMTFSRRNQILSSFNNLTSHLNQLQRFQFNANNGQARAQANAIISTINSLRDIVDSTMLGSKLKGFYNYKEQTKDLTRIKRRYLKLVQEIEETENLNGKNKKMFSEIKERVEHLVNKSKELEDSSSSTLNLKSQIERLYTQITSNAQDIEGKKVTINSIHKNAKELEEILENADIKITKIFKDTETKTDIFYNSEKGKFLKEIEDLQSTTSNIISTNVELQKKVNNLLEGANAGRLYKSFHWRKRQLEKDLWMWFSGVVAINVTIVLFTLLIVNGWEWAGIKEIDASNLDGAFFIKLFISIPLLFLDYFFIKEYNSRRDLIERYTFKSVLSLSLLAYAEMIKDYGENNDSKEFITKTVEQIYDSPFDKQKLSRKELDIVNNLAEKGLDHLKNLANKAVN